MNDNVPQVEDEYKAELILPKGGKCIADLRDESQILWLIQELLEQQKWK